MIVMFPAMPGVPTGHWTLDIVQVWGFWGSVPGDLPSSQPTILGFNEPDHKDQVWWGRTGVVRHPPGQHEPGEGCGGLAGAPGDLPGQVALCVGQPSSQGARRTRHLSQT